MPIRYFGNKTKDCGKPLWEILLNLKNLGIGRYVGKNTYLRKYETPCFYKVLDVCPHNVEYPNEKMRGTIIVEEVFRGRKRDDVYDIGDIAHNCDFRLFHKNEEFALIKQYNDFQANKPPQVVFPMTAQLPPVWKLLMKNEPDEENREEIDLLYEEPHPQKDSWFRLANPNEEPSFKLGPGGFVPRYKSLFKDVIWNRGKALQAYPPKDVIPDFIYLDKKVKKPV